MTGRIVLVTLLLALACGGSEEGGAEEPVPVSDVSGAEAEDPMVATPTTTAMETECRTEAEIDPVAAGDPIPPPADVAAPPPDAEVTATGLTSERLIRGCGSVHPTEESRVTVHYTGWTTGGEMFDSSVVRGREATFPLSRVIAGWTEGVQLMTVGEKRRFWIPADLAYGPNPRPGAPAGMLVFDVDLIAIDE